MARVNISSIRFIDPWRKRATWKPSRALDARSDTLDQEITQTLTVLAAGQQRLHAEQELTQKKLQAFIDSLRRGGNGHS